MFNISRFTAENLAQGCVTDLARPTFAFCLESSGQNVALKKAVLSVNGWQCETAEQVGLVYGGPALQPCTRYTANLVAESSRGETASAVVAFETGLMGGEWAARWITDGSYKFTQAKTSPVPLTFKKNIFCEKPIASARLYATALGIYELCLNGQKVGQDYFAPGFTAYKHQLQYQTYDVTTQLQGQNELVAVVAGGWAVGAFTYKRRNRVFAKRQAFLCRLHITYADGTSQVLGTDESWLVTQGGSYRTAEFYDGETYDATISLQKAQWRPAVVENPRSRPRLLAQYGAPVRAHEELTPISCTKAPGGEWIYDLGQNFAGVIRAKLNGRAGQTVTFRHAEILMEGELYTEPLRTAKQTATYVCTEGEQTYSPRLTYMGFRYVGVRGIEPQEIELTGLALYSDLPQNGGFTCSNDLVNQLQSSIVWGAKSNFVDIPTDCPQRDERLGWTGDIALFGPTAAFNFDMSRFFEKWLQDVKVEQRFGGGIPMIVPLVRVPFQWEIMLPMAVDHWGDACIWVPWAEYLARGDKGVLQRMYPTMQRYLKACQFWAGLFSVGQHRRIWRLLHHYGDWCAPGCSMRQWMSRGRWTATAALARSAQNLAQIARLLGHEAEANEYEQLHRATAQAYRSLLMDETCRLKGREFQTGYVLPLHYNILEQADKAKAAAHLARLCTQNDYHIGTGFPGTPYILFALADNGYAEEAFRMLLNDSCPSWLYEMKAGGTTIWERWDALREDGSCNTGKGDGTGGMVSFNHYASGAVGDFLYRRVAGIQPLEGGYRRFAVAPLPGGGLTHASAWVDTPYGRVKSSWQKAGGQFTLSVSVPVNTHCTVTLPGGAQQQLGSGEYVFKEEL